MFELIDYSKLVPKDSLTIDGEKLAGIDDFTIDARRCKAEIRLLNTNQSENQTIIDSLTDTSRLLKDGMETESLNCLVGSNDTMMEEFSYEKLFERHYNGLVETSSTTQTHPGRIYIQSCRLSAILYQTIINSANSNDNRKWYNRMTAMLYAMILKDGDPANYTNIMRAWIQQRYWHISETIDDQANYDLFIEKFEIFTSAKAGNNSATKHELWKPFSETLYSLGLTNSRSFALFNNGEWEEVVYYSTDYSDIGTYNLTQDQKDAYRVADFIASIISKDDYDYLVNKYIQNGMNATKVMNRPVTYHNQNPSTPTVDSWDYSTPFWLNKYVVNFSSSFTPYSTSKRYIFQTILRPQQVQFCKARQSNGLIIGNPQTKTFSDSTESNVPIINHSDNTTNIQYWNSFVPVQRTFKLVNSEHFHQNWGNTEFKFYMDNLKISSMLSTNNNFLFGTGFTETNWMYFDSIKCEERILLPNEDTFVDNIPVFDIEDETQVDDYGLYIYRDYFQTYYTKSASSVTDIPLQVKNASTGEILFTGLIDFNTVQISKKAITFEAIDAIGLLADNARKLNGIVHFSQFDTGGDGTIAEKKAGTTLKQFTETLIKTPFPYQHSLASDSFDIGNNSGLENKLLDTIETDKAIIMAIQCAKKLLYVDGTGKIQLDSVLGDRTATIDGQIIEESILQNTDIDELEFDQLKKVAGYDKFLPSIVSFYKSINYNYKKRIDMKIYGQTSEIKLLDKIIYKSKEYFVMEKNINLSNGHLSITLIGGI